MAATRRLAVLLAASALIIRPAEAGDCAPGSSEACDRQAAEEELDETPLLQVRAGADSNRSNRSNRTKGPSCCNGRQNPSISVYCDPFCTFGSKVGCNADGSNHACRYCGVRGSESCSVGAFPVSAIHHILGDVMRKFPGSTYTEAEWEPGDEPHGGVFEVEFTTATGEEYEVELTPEGRVLELERD